jgi:ubiquinone/menaquinone biosynthesis C-methylase UbiE
MATVSAGHYLLGTEGLALLRRWLAGDAGELGQFVDEMARFARSPDEAPLAIRFEVPQLDVEAGYARWATSYDDAPNPLIRAETPVVQAWIDLVPPGVALDAACGTGRHAAHLASRGHRVIAVDRTAAMLEKARGRVPEADVRQGDLAALPLEDESVDLAVCALALTHVSPLDRPIRELARVLRPGGTAILSDLHPTMLVLGGTAFFLDAAGDAGNVRSYGHRHADYLAAFRAAALDVVDCAEPPIEACDLAALSGAERPRLAARAAALTRGGRIPPTAH